MKRLLLVFLLLALLLVNACNDANELPDYKETPSAPPPDTQMYDNQGQVAYDATIFDELEQLTEKYLRYAYDVGDGYSAVGLQDIYPTERESDWEASVRQTEYRSQVIGKRIWGVVISNDQNAANVLISVQYNAKSLGLQQDNYLSLLRIRTKKADTGWVINGVETLICTTADSVVLTPAGKGEVTVTPVEEIGE